MPTIEEPTLRFRISQEMMDTLRAAAAQERRSISQVVRLAIENRLRDFDPCEHEWIDITTDDDRAADDMFWRCRLCNKLRCAHILREEKQ